MPTILALSRYRNLEKAADHLSVNRTTVLRQLIKVEEEVGAPLFERSRGKLTPTQIGQQFFSLAEHFEISLSELPSQKEKVEKEIAGPIRITVPPNLAREVAPLITGMLVAFPRLDVEILATYDFGHVGYGENDIALRLSRQKPLSPLHAQLLKKLPGALYKKRGAPISELISVYRTGEAPIPQQYDLQSQTRSVVNTDDIMMKLELIATGGTGRMPCFLGDHDERLERASDLLPDAGWRLWLVNHAAYRHTVKIKTVSDHISRYFSATGPTPAVQGV